METGEKSPPLAKSRPEESLLSFYCNVVNDQLWHEHDHPTIGMILFQTKDSVGAEYALSGIDKPIGVSSCELTRALPKSLQSVMPTVEQIDAELSTPETAAQPSKRKKASNRAIKKEVTEKGKDKSRKNG